LSIDSSYLSDVSIAAVVQCRMGQEGHRGCLKLHETEETLKTVGRDSRSLGRESKVIFLKYRAFVLSDKNSISSGAVPPRMLWFLTGGLRYYDERADRNIRCSSDKIMTVYSTWVFYYCKKIL